MNGGELETESVAFYGQASYDFRDAGGAPFRVVGGLRWTQDEKWIDEFQQIPAFGVDLSAVMEEKWGRDQRQGRASTGSSPRTPWRT